MTIPIVIEFSSLSDDATIQLAEFKLKTQLEDWERNIWQFISDWFNPSITSIKIFTSGSTGAPKQIEHSKKGMLISARMTCDALNLKFNDSALLCLPVNKIAGMMMIVRSIYCKMNLYFIKPSSAPLNDLNDDLKIDFAAFTPMQLYNVGKDNILFTQTEQISKIILGGENVNAELLQSIAKMQNKVYATFGMTETISHIALKKLNDKNPDKHFKVLSGIKISTDERNCLVIEAPTLEQPRLITNDVVKIFSEKEFDWLGRADNVINTGGVKLYPEELEQKLQAHIQSAFFIGAIADERTGEKLILAIEMDSLSDKDKRKLIAVILEFNKLERPKAILLFNQFVRTETGKIKRKETLQSSYKKADI